MEIVTSEEMVPSGATKAIDGAAVLPELSGLKVSTRSTDRPGSTRGGTMTVLLASVIG